MKKIKINNKSYILETFENKNENKIDLKLVNKYLKPKLNLLQEYCEKKNKYTTIDGNEIFYLKNLAWNKNNQKYPSREFIRRIDNLNRKQNGGTINITAVKTVPSESTDRVLDKKTKRSKEEVKNIKVESNKLMILDALMEHGGYTKKYYNKYTNKFIHSEHFGMLDFRKNKLDRVVISAMTNSIDPADNEIFFPNDPSDLHKYEYIFHTHPPTPKVGSRISAGIIYEFPSINDIFHFLKYNNNGSLQGSIVITPEGMYIIRLKDVMKKIKIDEERLYNNFRKIFNKVQDETIEKLKRILKENNIEKSLVKIDNKFRDIFYKNISTDMEGINNINNMIKEFNIFIDYFPRKKTNNVWILDNIILPVQIID